MTCLNAGEGCSLIQSRASCYEMHTVHNFCTIPGCHCDIQASKIAPLVELGSSQSHANDLPWCLHANLSAPPMAILLESPILRLKYLTQGTTMDLQLNPELCQLMGRSACILSLLHTGFLSIFLALQHWAQDRVRSLTRQSVGRCNLVAATGFCVT